MPDVNAAIGLAQLEQAERFRSERQRVAEYYYSHLAELEMIDLPVCHVPFENHSWHLYPVVLNEKAPVSRNVLIERLSAAGIGTSVHYKPLHRMTYYKNRYNLNASDFPDSERTWKGNLSLPIYPFMTEEELAWVCDNLRSILS
jgi:dTDP-4-amino-4,6-dideoxygalactose transaminase